MLSLILPSSSTCSLFLAASCLFWRRLSFLTSLLNCLWLSSKESKIWKSNLYLTLGQIKFIQVFPTFWCKERLYRKSVVFWINSTVKQLSGMGTFISRRKLRKLRLVGLSNVASPRNNLGFRKIEKKKKEKIR